MSRAWTALRVLLGAQAALAGVAATLEWTFPCGACRAGGLSLGLLGSAYYGGLLVSALVAGPTRALFCALFFGFGVHVMLVAQLVLAGLACGICFAAAGVSLALVGLAVACDRANLGRLAIVLPWAALLVVAAGGAPRSSAAAVGTAPGAVRVTVFTQPDCPYCDELRDRVMPEAEREFGSRLEVVYRPSSDLPAVRRTPTLVISPGRRDRPARVLEGLPSLGMLRDAIRQVEGSP